MPANGRYDGSGIKQLHRLRFSGGGLFLLPEFGRKNKFFLLQNVEFAKKACIFEKGMVYCHCNRISMSKRIEQERCMAKTHTQRGIVR